MIFKFFKLLKRPRSFSIDQEGSALTILLPPIPTDTDIFEKNFPELFYELVKNHKF